MPDDHQLQTFAESLLDHGKNREPQFGLMVADPITWTYLAGLFLSAIATEGGKTVGRGLGAAFLNALIGSTGNQQSSMAFQEALDRLYDRISTLIRTELRKEAIRAANVKTAKAQYMFYEFCSSYQTRRDELPNIDEAALDAWLDLKSLQPDALATLMAAGAIYVACGVERYARNRTPAEARSARLRIAELLQEVETSYNKIKSWSENRVVILDYIKEEIECDCYIDDDRLIPRSTDAGKANGDDESRIYRAGKCRVEVLFRRVQIDGGEPFKFPDSDCQGHNLNAIARSGEFAQSKIQEFANTFKANFTDPYEELKIVAARALERLSD